LEGAGVLLYFGKKKKFLEIFSYSRHHINAIIRDEDGSSGWKFTGFYRNPDIARRSESWDLLRHLKSFQPSAWLCAGDFNETIEQSEKGAALRHNS
jgi:hypothetical protein